MALKTLEHQTAEERLRLEIRESVRRCGAADKRELRDLAQAAVSRRGSDNYCRSNEATCMWWISILGCARNQENYALPW